MFKCPWNVSADRLFLAILFTSLMLVLVSLGMQRNVHSMILFLDMVYAGFHYLSCFSFSFPESPFAVSFSLDTITRDMKTTVYFAVYSERYITMRIFSGPASGRLV